MLVMDGDIIRVEIELRRAAVAAVVILAKLRGARATTLRTFDRFDMLGHSVYELCKEVCLGERAHTMQGRLEFVLPKATMDVHTGHHLTLTGDQPRARVVHQYIAAREARYA